MMNDLFSLKGRTALVTGGTRGIGRMIAQGFLEQGAKVYISGRNAERAEAAAKELSAFGTCIPLAIDAAGADGSRKLAAAYLAKESSLDILVHNAGAAWGAPFKEFPENGWDKVMDLNVKTPFFLTQALHGALKAKATADRPSKVVIIASVDGFFVNRPESYSYHASKAGVLHLAKKMAMTFDRRSHRRLGHRARRVSDRHEPGRARHAGVLRRPHPGEANRPTGGYRRRRRVPGEPGRQLCRRHHCHRRWRRVLGVLSSSVVVRRMRPCPEQ